MIATASCMVWLSESDQPVWAEPEDQGIVVSMPIYSQVVYGDWIAQAKQLVSNTINDQFNRNTGLSSIRVFVVGDRHGEVVPILMTTVSRSQWQENPEVETWARYYSDSYALLQRHDMRAATTQAAAPVRSATANFRGQFLIDEALDSGRLTGRAAQQYLSGLD